MKRALFGLVLLLVLQLLLAFTLHRGKRESSLLPGGRLLEIAQEQIDRIMIEGGEGTVLLQRNDAGRWTLPDHFSAGADQEKIDELLSTLLGSKRGWPVAETEEAIRRFKVGEKGFERRLRFLAGDKELGSLFLGSSSNLRQVHARSGGERQVFAIPFALYKASLKPSDWVDKGVLRLPLERIKAIDLPDCRLVRKEGEFVVTDAAEGERTDTVKTRQLVQRLAGLTILDIQGKSDQPLPKPPVLSLSLELEEGAARRYDFAPSEQEGKALLWVSENPWHYQIPSFLLQEAREAVRAKLVAAGVGHSPPATN